MQRKWLWVSVGIAAVEAVLIGLVVAAVGDRPAPLTSALAIPVGEFRSALSVTPDGQRILLAGSSGQVDVVDTATNTVLGSLGTDSANDVLVAPDGRTAYVVGFGQIGVVDLTTNLVVGSIALTGPAAEVFRLVAVTPDGQRIIASDSGGGAVVAIEIPTGSSVALTSTGPGLEPPALTPDGSRIYVTPDDYTGPGLVRVVDTATGTSREVPGSNGIAELVMSPDGRSVYGFGIGGTRVIDTATDTVTETIGRDFVIGTTVMAHDGSHLFVFGAGDDLMEVRTLDNHTVAGAPIGGFAKDSALSPDGRRLYVLVDESLLVFDVSAYA